ncbi:MAG TPA: DUF2662 domain-containing protein [Anaerolineales bacterium]|nr:DUF2662 domain-containing protein [Anaerolineae bacterium]HIP87799.1 DUF2662 domain-containing protein [Anaerolineales bacterium]
MNRIERFETLAERLVEGTFARLFAGCLHPLEVATHLARAMEDHRVRAPDGTFLAPTHYWIYLHPKDFGLLVARRPSLAEDLAEHVAHLAQEAGLTLAGTPVVSVEPLVDVPPRSIRVEAQWRPSEEIAAGSTREMAEEEHEVVRSAAEEEPQGRPFLIIEGGRHVDLVEPVVNIGRALDNDIILEDPRVSRHHAQLRRRFGRYVLYDLGSSGGTTVNGYPVQECVLQPGDVLSFAGVEVIYGENPLPMPPSPDGEDMPALEEGE